MTTGVGEVQLTLVDCPGHASLIKTIIGGAQIIDIMMLVIDVTKGLMHCGCSVPECCTIRLRSLQIHTGACRTSEYTRLLAEIFLCHFLLTQHIDAGVQTQTAECLVIGEITCSKLVCCVGTSAMSRAPNALFTSSLVAVRLWSSTKPT